MTSAFLKPGTQAAACLAVVAFVVLQGCVQPPETAGVSHAPIALQPEVATRDEPLAGARVAVRDEPAVDKKMLTARITVTPREHSFTVSLYLRSASGQDIRVVRGRGSAGVQNVPEFFLGDLRITPPTYVHPARRTTIPDTQMISPEYDKLYGAFTMGWPSGWKPTWPRRDREKEMIRARIAFPELGVTVETEAVSIEPFDPDRKVPGAGRGGEYAKEIERLQAAGQLEAIRADHDEDGTTDLVLHLRQGGLVKLVEYPHLVKTELPLPEWGEYDRIEYGHHSATRPDFTVTTASELRAFHECLKRASRKLDPGVQDYYRPDGEPFGFGIVGGGWGHTGPSILFKKGDTVLCRGQVSGAKCWLSRTERGSRVYFVNRALGPLVRRQMEKAGYRFETESQ